MTTTIHQLGASWRCALCGVALLPDHAQIGEYVGKATFAPELDLAPRYWRVGSGNRDALCDGRDHTRFAQESYGPANTFTE